MAVLECLNLDRKFKRLECEFLALILGDLKSMSEKISLFKVV